MRSTSLIIFLLVGCGQGFTPMTSASAAPASAVVVANDYVTTPFGLVHSSCVTEVAEGSRIADPHTIVISDHTEKLSHCLHPMRHTRRPPDAINGWVEAADWEAAATPQSLSTTWVVPDIPTGPSGQLLYYFPSFMPQAQNRIIQPVLQYGVGAAGGGNYWAIASWYVTSDTGQAKHSPLLQVSPGDTIVGTLTASACSGDGACDYTIVSADASSGESRTLVVSETVPYTSIQAAVLEAYNVSSCDQFPASELTFSELSVIDAEGDAVVPQWSTQNWKPSLACGFAIDARADAVTLSY